MLTYLRLNNKKKMKRIMPSVRVVWRRRKRMCLLSCSGKGIINIINYGELEFLLNTIQERRRNHYWEERFKKTQITVNQFLNKQRGPTIPIRTSLVTFLGSWLLKRRLIWRNGKRRWMMSSTTGEHARMRR